MKKRIIFILLALILAGSIITYVAGANDSLVSLSYLRSTFTDAVLKKAHTSASGIENAVSGGYAERRFKCGDRLTVNSGGSVIVLAGEVIADFGGTVVDTAEGTEVHSGDTLVPNHRYLVAENTTASFITTGKTSCMDYMGPANMVFSDDTPDYNAMAEALKSLHLLRGSYTGYGSGYDLEQTPTRRQALIMFIRMLGEEDEALSYKGSCPFTDLNKDASTYPYIAYAYSKGYTHGFTKTEFCPEKASNTRQYMAFILRAMSYLSQEETKISDVLDIAKDRAIITENEYTAFQANGFLRADLVYLSYYALDAKLANREITLAENLMSQGIFSENEYRSARTIVNSKRP